MSGAAERDGDVTDLLRAWRGGDEPARDELLERVYRHLRRVAAAQLRAERAGHTLQPTALVHEAYLRLVDQSRVDWRDRSHFFGLAAATMRRVLVDHARRRGRKKRQFDEPGPGIAPQGVAVDLIDLDRALERLAADSARTARVVELRYFGGLELDEIAACLEISRATVKRDWEFARAFLRTELEEAD